MGNGFGATASALESMVSSLHAASKKMQTAAGECFELSNRSFDHATKALEKFRGARGLDDVVKIQTNFAKEAVENATSCGRKFGELMAVFPSDIAKTYQDAWFKSIAAAVEAVQHVRHAAATNVISYSEAVKKSATGLEQRESLLVLRTLLSCNERAALKSAAPESLRWPNRGVIRFMNYHLCFSNDERIEDVDEAATALPYGIFGHPDGLVERPAQTPRSLS